MQIKGLRRRYHLDSDQEIIRAIKENLESINQKGNHAYFSNGSWMIDEEAVKYLDTVFSYIEDDERETSKGDNERNKETAQENTRLQQKIEAMQKELAEARETARNYAEDFQEIQNKYLAMQEGQTETNTAMIRKAKARADQAEKELERVSARFHTLQADSQQEIATLKDKVNELMEKLMQSNGIMEQRVKAEFDLLQSKKAEDKLYEQLREGEKKTSELTEKLVAEKEGHQQTLQSIDSLKSDMVEWVALCQKLERQMSMSLSTLTSHLSDDASEKEHTVPDSANEVVATKEQAAPPVKAITKKKRAREHEMPTPHESNSQIEKRNDLLEEMRAEQKARKDAKRQGFWHRVASFF